MHLVGFIIIIYEDERSSERQKRKSYCMESVGGFGMSVCNWVQSDTHSWTVDAPNIQHDCH